MHICESSHFVLCTESWLQRSDICTRLGQNSYVHGKKSASAGLGAHQTETTVTQQMCVESFAEVSLGFRQGTARRAEAENPRGYEDCQAIPEQHKSTRVDEEYEGCHKWGYP